MQAKLIVTASIGKLSMDPAIKKERALEKARQVAIQLGLDPSAIENSIKLPEETEEDKVYEAEAVLAYFELRGVGYNHATCKKCGEQFAYGWTFKGVQYCSTSCRKRALKDIGIDWDSNRTLNDRYQGHQSRPGVVPPTALHLLQEQLALDPDIQADLKIETSVQ